MTTYTVTDMRFIRAKGKTLENNPDRIGTVYGKFFSAKGEKLSITSKVIDKDIALSDEFAIDLVNGTLTIPSGERGRKPSVSASQSEVDDLLNSLRNPEPVSDPVKDETAKD